MARTFSILFTRSVEFEPARQMMKNLLCILFCLLLAVCDLCGQPWSDVTLSQPTVVAGGGGSFTCYGTWAGNAQGNAITNSSITGISDSKLGLASVWFKRATGQTTQQILQVGTMDVGFVNPEVGIKLKNSGGTIILFLYGTSPSFDVWHHVLISWDLSTAGRRRLFVDGVDQSNQVTFTDDTGDLTTTNNIVLANETFTAVDCSVSEVYFTVPASYYDLSVSANVEKFIVGGEPVSLGADGSTPTGTQPLLYFKNPAVTFEVNSGSGGDFYRMGTLTSTNSPCTD